MKYILPVALLLAYVSSAASATEVHVPAGGWVTIGITAPSGAVITIDSSGEAIEQKLPILINAGGGDFTDFGGRTWLSDAAFVTGGNTIDRGRIDIDRTDLDYVYKTERYGKSTFAVPVENGRYDVRFHYAETYNNGPGRNTGAIAEGRSLDPADVYMLAGGARKAVTRTLRDVSVQDGTLTISLTGKSPMLNGIEVAPANSLPADEVFTPPPPVTPPPVTPPPPNDPPVTQSDQCDPSKVPALARDRGFNKLAFCEDFSDPRRINLTSNKLGAGQTMVQNHIFNAQANPPDRFQFADGVLTMRPVNSNYQGHLITTEKGGAKGFKLRGGGWYTEARIRHLGDYRTWPGCTAFWSMDSDHLDRSVGKNFLEPDFWENISGSEVTALHNWQDMTSNPRRKQSEQFVRGMQFDPKQWFTVGALIEQDLSAFRWHRDGRITGSKSPGWLTMFNDFDGPIIIGSGSACPIQIDYIRAWSK